MRHKIFLFPTFGLVFFLLGFSNDLNVHQFSNTSLAGKYHYEYDHCKTDPKSKNDEDCISGWHFIEEKLLLLNEDGTFVLEQLQPQGGFEVLPVKGRWNVSAEGVLFLSGAQYYETEYLYFFEKIFSTFNGYIIEKDNRKQKNRKKSNPIVPWIKQN